MELFPHNVTVQSRDMFGLLIIGDFNVESGPFKWNLVLIYPLITILINILHDKVL